jgi:hypothetical protein
MSIWHSIGADIPATDLHTATGETTLIVDVATATAWTDRVRIAIFGDDATDVCLTISRDDAQTLRHHLAEAIAKIDASR